jgi:RNA polymerase-binding transcription factor DksA
MLPTILLRAGPVTIYSFGVFLFLAAFIAAFLVWRKARKIGLSEEKVFDTFLLTALIGLISGRIGFVVNFWSVFQVDFSRILLIHHYPGLSFPWAFTGGLLTAVLVGRTMDLGAFLMLDIFTWAFSWATVMALFGLHASWQTVVVFGIIALLWSLLGRLIDRSVNFAILARRYGLFSSSYLIFFALCLLMVPGVARQEETILYLVLLFLSLIVFLMKFPANVLGEIKKHLEAKVEEAQKRLKDLKKEDPFEDKSRLLDHASEDSDVQSKVGHERVEAMQRQMTMVLVQTRKALTKIKLGKYGICESCSKMIDTDRLAAMPAATMCLSCEKKREK